MADSGAAARPVGGVVWRVGVAVYDWVWLIVVLLLTLMLLLLILLWNRVYGEFMRRGDVDGGRLGRVTRGAIVFGQHVAQLFEFVSVSLTLTMGDLLQGHTCAHRELEGVGGWLVAMRSRVRLDAGA